MKGAGLTLLFVRHGTTTWNLERRYQGQTDIPLSDHGREEARLLGVRLASTQVDAIVTSTLQRTRETASIARSQWERPPADAWEDSRLNELAFGGLEGLTWNEGQARYPNAAAAWLSSAPGAAFPGGESLMDLSKRTGAFLRDLMDDRREGTVVVIAHGGSLRHIIGHLLGLDVGHSWRIELAPCSLSRATIVDGAATLGLLNDTCHLEAAQGGQ